MKNTLQNHNNTTSSSKKTNKLLLATALAGVLMTASCADESKKGELNIGTNAQKELVDTSKTNTPKNTVSNSENSTNEEVNIDPESLSFLDEYENEEIAQLEQKLTESEKELAESEKELAKVRRIGEALKAANKQQASSFEVVFNDPIINEETLENNPEFRKAFCEAYWVYEEIVKEHRLQKNQRAKALEPLYKKFKNK